MPRLSEEVRREIRELQESGVSDAEISRKRGIPYSTVRYQRPDVRKHILECMREYYRRCILEEDPDFKELLDSIEGNGHLSDRNVYVSILKRLEDTPYGKKYKQVARDVGNNIRGKLMRLRNLGLVVYEDDERYRLSEKGCELIKELFER